MTSTFKNIFELALYHDFYKEEKCCDFTLLPVSAAARMMSNHGALFRTKENNAFAVILSDASDTTAARPIRPDVSLVFAMKLDNYAFSNFTNEFPSAGKIFLFSNNIDPTITELDREEIFLCGNFLQHRIVSNLAVMLVLKDAGGNELARSSFEAGSSGIAWQFDVKLPANDFYTVTEDVTGDTFTYYSDKDLLVSGIFGLIRITNHATSPFTYDGALSYTISFTSSSRTWRYYVVAPGMSAADITAQLSVVNVPDLGMTAIAFTKTYPVPANDKTAPTLHKDTSKIALFASDQQLAFQQVPRKRIELRKNGTVLINHMPNPDVYAPGTEMFIYV